MIQGIAIAIYSLVYRTLLVLIQIGVFGTRAKVWALAERQYEKRKEDSQTILCCVASVGEYLYIHTLIEHFKRDKNIVISVFSPEALVYLKERYEAENIQFIQAPFDTRRSVSALIDNTTPVHVIISSNEIWPVFLKELHRSKIKYSFVGLTVKSDTWAKRLFLDLIHDNLQHAENIFTHSEETAQSLSGLHIDRSYHLRIEQCIEPKVSELPTNIVEFCTQSCPIFVFASVHTSDLPVLKSLLPILKKRGYRSMIVPHHIDSHTLSLMSSVQDHPISLSSTRSAISDDILIIDELGHLQSLYAYASICYVGGGFDEGLHSILEPIIQGVPTLIGPNFEKFAEVPPLLSAGYAISIKDPENAVGLFDELRQRSFNQMEALQALGYFEHLGSEDIALQIQTTLPSA